MGTRLIGYVLIGIALVMVAVVVYFSGTKSETPLIFSPSQILDSTWLNYTHTYLESGTGRTLDPQSGDITTSEGESYTMLRAVWMGDKTTFDQSWTWTKDNLQHKSGLPGQGDSLFAWLFGKEPNGTYGVLTAQGGETTASDADTDIALSLLFAYSRWQDHQYLGDARVIMSDIWNDEVIEVNGVPYLAADNKEKTSKSSTIAIDPSYFNPAAYQIFAEFDDSHPWGELASSSYALLEQSMSIPLDASKSAGLPPDWIAMNRTTGAISAMQSTTDTTNFGFDALRVPWRIALDWEWFQDPRAKQVLGQMSFLSQEWQSSQQLATTYAHDGSIIDPEETPAMYGGTIGYFLIADPSVAQTVYEEKLAYLYDPGKNAWKSTLSYYDDNWAWFGIGLYNNELPNLTANLPKAAFNQ